MKKIKEGDEVADRPGSYPGAVQRRNAGRSPQATEADSPALPGARGRGSAATPYPAKRWPRQGHAAVECSRCDAAVLRLLDEVLGTHKILQMIYGDLPALLKLDRKIEKITERK